MQPQLRLAWLVNGLLILAGASPAVSYADEPARQPPKKLVVEVKVVDVPTTKLKNLGFDWTRLMPDSVKHDSIDEVLQSAPAERLIGFLEALRQNNLARFLAEPTIATLDGRPASFSTGATQLDLAPVVLGNGHVRLEYRIELAAPQKEPARIATKRESEPGARPFKLDSAVELELGKTAIVGRTKTNTLTEGGKTQETETLVFVRVDLLEHDLTPTRTAGTTTTAAEFREVPRAPVSR
jgi:hypothetical protein